MVASNKCYYRMGIYNQKKLMEIKLTLLFMTIMLSKVEKFNSRKTNVDRNVFYNINFTSSKQTFL